MDQPILYESENNTSHAAQPECGPKQKFNFNSINHAWLPPIMAIASRRSNSITSTSTSTITINSQIFRHPDGRAVTGEKPRFPSAIPQIHRLCPWLAAASEVAFCLPLCTFCCQICWFIVPDVPQTIAVGAWQPGGWKGGGRWLEGPLMTGGRQAKSSGNTTKIWHKAYWVDWFESSIPGFHVLNKFTLKTIEKYIYSTDKLTKFAFILNSF